MLHKIIVEFQPYLIDLEPTPMDASDRIDPRASGIGDIVNQALILLNGLVKTLFVHLYRKIRDRGKLAPTPALIRVNCILTSHLDREA